jgi:hypothetical protein
MNEPMSDSFKREVEEFKKWAENGQREVVTPSLAYHRVLGMKILVNPSKTSTVTSKCH